jgi:hypothetical protein
MTLGFRRRLKEKGDTMPTCHYAPAEGERSASGKCFPTRLVASFFAFFVLCSPCVGSQTPSSGTAPLILDGNRVYAELAFVRPDGTLHKVLAFVDLGSPSTILSEALFNELQLDQKKPLTFMVGDMTVRVDPNTVTSDAWLPYSIADNRKVEALLPAGVLQKYQLVIDYAHRLLTLAQPGLLKPTGVPVPFRINEKTGLIAVDVSINRRSYPVTIDSGSAYTWLGKATVQEWLEVHPDWQRGVGAVGPSNMRMADDGIEAAGVVVRIPEIRLGSLILQQIGALAIGSSNTNWDFIDWYSQKNPGSVIGWLGGNVLQGFRITIDYPNHMSYWLRQTELDPHDLDQVGLTLRSKSGEYFVAAIATQNGNPTVKGVQAGDKLLQIGALHTGSATSSAVFSAMHGKPGESRTLLVERDTRQFTVRTKVGGF